MEPRSLYKVSVTTLEKFRRFMAGLTPFDTEDALIETIQGKFEGNDKTRFGGAFHKIVEHPHLADVPGNPVIEEDGLKISVPHHVAKVAAAYRMEHPLMVCEVPVSKRYISAKYAVQVTGRVDGSEGAQVRDTKTKYRAVAATEYMDSYQWRFYLDMLGLKLFNYDIFEIKYFDGFSLMNGIHFPVVTMGRDKQPRDLQVIYHEPITCTGYLGMQGDCERLVAAFMDYIETRNFFHLLKTVPYEVEAV